MPTVYKIYAISDEEVFYVGSTTTPLNARFNRHKYSARKGLNNKLHRTMRERGIDDWAIEGLEEVESTEELTEREQEYIDSLQPPLNSKFAHGYDLERKAATVKANNTAWYSENKMRVAEKNRANAYRFNCTCGYHTAHSTNMKKHLRLHPGDEHQLADPDDSDAE